MLSLCYVCPKYGGVHERLMFPGKISPLFLGRRPMEEAKYLASLLAQDEGIICVAIWSCESYENKLWFGKTVISFSHGQCINSSPWFCGDVLTSFPSCCLNILETRASYIIHPSFLCESWHHAIVVELVRLCGPPLSQTCCCLQGLQQGTASEATHQGPLKWQRNCGNRAGPKRFCAFTAKVVLKGVEIEVKQLFLHITKKEYSSVPETSV